MMCNMNMLDPVITFHHIFTYNLPCLIIFLFFFDDNFVMGDICETFCNSIDVQLLLTENH